MEISKIYRSKNWTQQICYCTKNIENLYGDFETFKHFSGLENCLDF